MKTRPATANRNLGHEISLRPLLFHMVKAERRTIAWQERSVRAALADRDFCFVVRRCLHDRHQLGRAADFLGANRRESRALLAQVNKLRATSKLTRLEETYGKLASLNTRFGEACTWVLRNYLDFTNDPRLQRILADEKRADAVVEKGAVLLDILARVGIPAERVEANAFAAYVDRLIGGQDPAALEAQLRGGAASLVAALRRKTPITMAEIRARRSTSE